MGNLSPQAKGHCQKSEKIRKRGNCYSRGSGREKNGKKIENWFKYQECRPRKTRNGPINEPKVEENGEKGPKYWIVEKNPFAQT